MLHLSKLLHRIISPKQAKYLTITMFAIGSTLVIISLILLLSTPTSPPNQVPIQVQEVPLYPEPQQPVPAIPPRHHNASAPFAATL
jgi:hypothetical protein